MQEVDGRPAWVLRIIQARRSLGWGQRRLAVEIAGLIGRRTGRPADPANVQRRLVDWETGKWKPSQQSWELLACALDVSMTWLRDGTHEEDEDVERRELLTALGLVGVAGLAPQVAASRRVGMTDVDHVRSVTSLYRAADNKYGGAGLGGKLAAFAERCEALLSGRYTDLVGQRLHHALADARDRAGWAHFDAGEHRRAHAQWRLATVHARRAGAADKLASIGYSRTRQHQHLGRPADAVATVREAQSAAAGKVTPTVESMLGMQEAVSLAMLGDQPGALTALQRAQDAFARREPAADPEWVWFFDAADLAAKTGEAHRWLARSDRRYAEEALRCSTVAVTSYTKGMVRVRALTQVDLAAGHALAGDPGQAVVEGRRALAAAGELRSRRLLDRLVTLPADLAGAPSNPRRRTRPRPRHPRRAAGRFSIGRGSAGSAEGTAYRHRKLAGARLHQPDRAAPALRRRPPRSAGRRPRPAPRRTH
jgi:hypothetical protein